MSKRSYKCHITYKENARETISNRVKNKKAIVLLSGGLDSATTLYIARRAGYKIWCLIFDYNQRHNKEVRYAKHLARKTGCPYRVVKFKLPWGGSSLLDRRKPLPQRGRFKGIPSTYVPARNTIFIAFAISWAEALGAEVIYLGANTIDFSGYPDCRPDYFKRYQRLIDVATKTKGIRIEAPLVNKTKAEIIKTGVSLGVPYRWTWSCYKGSRRPCRKCDSCRLREKGFREAGVKDPLK